MNKPFLTLMKHGMRFIYFFMKLVTPVRNRAVFLSRQANAPSTNFLLLENELKKADPTIRCSFYCRLGLKTDMGFSYAILMLRQMKALAGARVCITESYCIPVSLLRHKKQLRVIQIWHSMVAIKKFGWQTVDLPEGTPSEIASLMQMHGGYDFVTVGSEYMRRFFSEAMNTPEEKILPIGSPVADRIICSASRYDELRRRFYEAYPDAADKKIAVYLPTMRRDYSLDLDGVIDSFDCGEYALVIKLHPLDRTTHLSGDRAIADRTFSTEEAIILADAVISDYSGAAAEAALLDKPVYFFVPDIDRYSAECGLNVNPLRVFPGVSFTDPTKLAEAILQERASKDDFALVRELLCGGCDGHSAEKTARLALTGKA